MAGASKVLGGLCFGALGSILLASSGSAKTPPPTLQFRSRPDLAPPVVTVATDKPGVAPGYLFIAPKQDALEKGPEILDDRGQPIWFDPVAQEATDFRVQTYRGKPVLTYWEGPPTAPVLGSGVGHDVVVDTSYRVIARVDAGYGPDTADKEMAQPRSPRGGSTRARRHRPSNRQARSREPGSRQRLWCRRVLATHARPRSTRTGSL